VYDIRRRSASIVRPSALAADHFVMESSAVHPAWERPGTAVYPDRHYVARWRYERFPPRPVPWERTLCLNLDGVFLDAGALHELVLALARDVKSGAYGPAALMIATSDESTASVIELCAAQYELPLYLTGSAVDPLTHARPVGALTSNESETLDLILHMGGEITSAKFAESAGMKVSAAGNRLTSLAAKGYLHRRRRPKREGDVYVDPRVFEGQPSDQLTHPAGLDPVDVPEDLSEAVRQFAAAQGEQPGDVLLRAWREFAERHADAMRVASEEAGRLIAQGDREGLRALANRHARDRAMAAAARAAGKR
jgi:predicted transcriptional regulator